MLKHNKFLDIKYLFKEGHIIINLLRKVTTITDIEKIDPRVENFTKCADKILSEIDEDTDMNNGSEISFYLYMAYNWKLDAIKEQNQEMRILADGYIDDFENYLDFNLQNT